MPSRHAAHASGWKPRLQENEKPPLGLRREGVRNLTGYTQWNETLPPLAQTNFVWPGVATEGIGTSPHEYSGGVSDVVEFMACSQPIAWPV